MANHGYELSPPSNTPSQTLYDDDESSNTSQYFAMLSRKTRSTKGIITTSITPSSSSNPDSPETITPAPKKPRGRPRGSKNKPKPPVTIIKEVEDKAFKPVVIEIATGSDLVIELTKFAQSHEMGLVVLNGSGCVTNVSLRQPFFNNSLTLNGTYTLLSLSSTYINIMNSSTTTLSPSSPITCSQNCSSFTVCVAGTEGQVFGGIVAAKIVAASVVVVVAMLCKKPMFQRLPNNNDVKTLIKVSGDDDNNDDAVMRTMALPTISTFGVLNPSPINFHLPSDQANVNEAPWGYPNLHPSNHN